MVAERESRQTDTRGAILDIAERFVQQRGFNGFSYADVAGELAISKAALHYHFAGKAELGEALVSRYAVHFVEALARIDGMDVSAAAKLHEYADLYLGVLRAERMCLCGMLAAEYQTLPDPMRRSLVQFFDDNHAWLARLLESGRVDGSLAFSGTAEAAARMIVGALEGAMLVSRPYADPRRFEDMAARVIDGFVVSTPRRRRRSR